MMPNTSDTTVSAKRLAVLNAIHEVLAWTANLVFYTYASQTRAFETGLLRRGIVAKRVNLQTVVVDGVAFFWCYKLNKWTYAEHKNDITENVTGGA
jgi:hypothetical protein